MSGFTFDANIIIDALLGIPDAKREIDRARRVARPWVSRMAWIEVLSKGTAEEIASARAFLAAFAVDEVDGEIAERAAGLRRERSKLRAADAVILATAQARGRILVTRNTKDFPANLPGIRVPYEL